MLDLTQITKLIADECAVDRVHDDVTVRALGESALSRANAFVKSRAEGVFSGDAVVRGFSKLFEGSVQFRCLVAEGQSIRNGDSLVEMKGSVGSCLSLERTLVNYLSHSCGVATTTRHFVEAVKPHPVKILATRKTLPGLREIQLQAVVAGGGHIHRRSLSDGILIKDNHQVFLNPRELLKNANENRSPLHRVEIEVQDLNLLDTILEQSPDLIMLDNLSVEKMMGAIQKIRSKTNGRCAIEVSGGITLATIAAVAALGVDYISVGALTHSAPSLNLSLDIEKANP